MLDDGTVYHDVIHEGRLPSVDWRDATPRTSSAYTFNEDAAQLEITAVPKICNGDPHIEGCSDHG